MKNRIKWIWSTVMLLSFPSVFAQEGVSKGIGDMLYKMFGYIFVDIGKLGIGDRFYEFFMRFLLWIVIFACLFYAARFVFKEQKRIQIVVALVIALISIIMIPTAVLQWILQGYSILTALLLLAFPMIGVIYLIHKVFGAPERHNYAIKAFLYYLLAMLIYNIHGVTAHYRFPGFDDWLGFAEGICLILAVWNAIRSMFPGGGEESTPGKYWPERESRGQPSTSRGETPIGRGPGTGEPGRPGEPGTPGVTEEGTPSSGQPIILGPPIPPNQPPPGPGDQGDDPNPPRDPKTIEPKDPPRPEDPKLKPKKIDVPKGERLLIDNLWRWFLSIRNQDGFGACGAFAGTSILEYIINRLRGYLTPEAKISELFLWFYGRIDRNRDTGMYAHSIINELLKRGVCKYRLWTFEDNRSKKYIKEPGEDAQADAPHQRIVEYAAVDNDPDDWIAVLAEGNPIFICVDAPLKLNSGTKGYLGESGGYAATTRGHAMVICGYDSHYPDGSRRNEAFRVRNSWGYGWGDKGYVWIARELLKEMVSRHSGGGYVFTGWQKHLPKKFPARIEGRVIFDNGDINPERTGAEYYLNDKIASPKPGYHVGVIAQVKGTIYNVVDIPVQSPDGRFVLDFPWDAERFEPLTQLSKQFPSLKHIDFKKQPAGVVIYRKYDKNLYSFHIVDFKDSMLGRGGEGIHYPNNPRSDMISKGLKFSGRPIVFSNDHIIERNVIIPIFMEKEEEKKGLKEIIVQPNYNIKIFEKDTLIAKAMPLVVNAIAIGPKLFKKLGLKGKIGKGVIQHAIKHQQNIAYDVMIKKDKEKYMFMHPELMAALNLKDGSEVTLEYGRDSKGMLYLVIGFYYALGQ